MCSPITHVDLQYDLNELLLLELFTCISVKTNRFKPNEYESGTNFCSGSDKVYRLADVDADGT